jgi:hypothetical protein
MISDAGRVTREVKAMTRLEVMTKAQEGRITWLQAADICRMSARHMRRLRDGFERYGVQGLRDGRGKNGRARVALSELARVAALKRDVYPDFTVQHFYEKACELHGLTLSYTWTLGILQAAGLAEKLAARGTYRRRRERRPMRGMMLHLDASTHAWVADLPMSDLNVAMDDADGSILHWEFVPQEGTMSTLSALRAVLQEHGRFSEFYTDRGSHFCRTAKAGEGPADAQGGQVARVLRTLGIRHILARSPQARGRSERMFLTLQGRLPQELRLAGVRDYAAANAFLKGYLPRFNKLFAVKPAQPESAFTPMVGMDLDLVVSEQHERTVRNDSTVTIDGVSLQLPEHRDRPHFVRCLVLVHRLVGGELAVSYQGRWLGRFTSDGERIPIPRSPRRSTTVHNRAPKFPVSPPAPPPLSRCKPHPSPAL